MMLDRNPFRYGSPVSGEFFTGRASEISAIKSRIRNGVNVVVMSPRRYGKTSLLLRVREELVAENAALLWTSVLRSRDSADLVSTLANQLFRLPGAKWHRLKNALADFVRRLRVTPTVTMTATGEPSFSFQPALAAGDVQSVLSDLYAMLSTETQKRPAGIVLDEFQAITDLDEQLPLLLKALADEYPNVSLVLAGSKRHLMERLTLSAGAPLFGMAERFALGPIQQDAMIDYLVSRFETGKRPIGQEVAVLLATYAGPIPNNIQRLAYETFELATAKVEKNDEELIESAFAQAISHEADRFDEEIERLAVGQRRIMFELAKTPTESPFSGEFARSVRLANPSSVKRSLNALLEAELIRREPTTGQYQIADPFLRKWLTEN